MQKIHAKQRELKTFDLSEYPATPEEQAILAKCKSFPYLHDTHRRWVKPLAYTLTAVIAVAGVMLGVMNRPEWMGLCVVAVFAVVLAIAISERQIGMMKKLTQYFKDENGEFYRVIFTQGASMVVVSHKARKSPSAARSALGSAEQKAQMVDRNLEEAQEKYPAFYYVQRFKQGIRDWDPFRGGMAKVTHLEKLTLIARGEKNNRYSCQIDGKDTVLKIPVAHEGLAEEAD
ncbi:MAG: hypothetical protein E7316_11405 [Clostridiales bacterium]|nr:hypothetical protein [Clostridiales bacterium]